MNSLSRICYVNVSANVMFGNIRKNVLLVSFGLSDVRPLLTCFITSPRLIVEVCQLGDCVIELNIALRHRM